MKHKEKVDKARTQVVLRERFFATLLMYMRVTVDKCAATMWTDGKSIGYSPAFVEKLREDELVFVIMHELLHVYFLHHLRRGTRNAHIFNMACDYVVNLVLINCGYKLPEGGLLDYAYVSMTAEEVYAILIKKISARPVQQKVPAPSSGKPGDNKDKGGQAAGNPEKSDKQEDGHEEQDSLSDRLTEEEKESAMRGEVRQLKKEDGNSMSEAEANEAHQEMKKIIAIADRVAKSAGLGSSSLYRELKASALVTEANWGRLIDYVAKLSHDESSWSYPNRRYVHSGVYMPSLRGYNSLGDIVLAMDSSGSIDDETWASYMASFRTLFEQYKRKEVTVVICDDRIQKVCPNISPEELENIKNLGGGGTDFRPVFDWLEAEGRNVDLLIYCTDLQCSYYPSFQPQYPVVWAAWQSYSDRRMPPFGEVIRV